MKDEEEKYEEHVKKGWCFAKKTADTLTDDERLRLELAVKIFDKLVSPWHYFLLENGSGEPAAQPPTEKQIAFALRKGIKNPEAYSRQRLSDEIDKAIKKEKEVTSNG